MEDADSQASPRKLPEQRLREERGLGVPKPPKSLASPSFVGKASPLNRSDTVWKISRTWPIPLKGRLPKPPTQSLANPKGGNPSQGLTCVLAGSLGPGRADLGSEEGVSDGPGWGPASPHVGQVALGLPGTPHSWYPRGQSPQHPYPWVPPPPPPSPPSPTPPPRYRCLLPSPGPKLRPLPLFLISFSNLLHFFSLISCRVLHFPPPPLPACDTLSLLFSLFCLLWPPDSCPGGAQSPPGPAAPGRAAPLGRSGRRGPRAGAPGGSRRPARRRRPRGWRSMSAPGRRGAGGEGCGGRGRGGGRAWGEHRGAVGAMPSGGMPWSAPWGGGGSEGLRSPPRCWTRIPLSPSFFPASPLSLPPPNLFLSSTFHLPYLSPCFSRFVRL